MSNMRILLLDIETSPHRVYVWSLFDQVVNLDRVIEAGGTLSWAAKWYGTKGIMFNSLQKEKAKGGMIKEIHALLEEADVVVHYNGKKFDIPVLNKEFILAGLTPPSGYKEIDLYHVVKHRFRFASNKLSYVSGALGIGAKTNHKGMELWKGCMDGDKKSWAVMEKYNKQDVNLLEKLYVKVLPWIKQHPNHGLYVDEGRPVCKNCGSKHVIKNGVEFTTIGKYHRFRCGDCGTPLRGSVLLNKVSERREMLR
jgi:DNA polymerase elongation subunit (family B)